MSWSRILAAMLFLTIGIPAFATINEAPAIVVPWQTASFAAKLPPPFHLVSVVLQSNASAPQNIAIEVNGKSLKIDEELLRGLSTMKVDSIAYSNPNLTDSGSIEYFDVLIYFGDNYKVRTKPCDEVRDFTWEQDIVVFHVDRALTVSREVVPARLLDTCGP